MRQHRTNAQIYADQQHRLIADIWVYSVALIVAIAACAILALSMGG